jgi:colanic acid biosynthesis glycosyl transferase WcaI
LSAELVVDIKNNMNVLFLSHYFWPEEMATAEMLSGIAFSLSRSGISVSGLAGHPAYRKLGIRIPRVVEHEGVKVRRVWSTQLDKNRTLGRVQNAATFAVSSLISCLLAQRPKILITVTNPPLLIWVAWAVHLLRRIPYVLVIHDVYPDVAVALKRVPQGSLVDRTWRFLNRLSYKRAYRIVALGDCMAEVLRAELPSEQRNKVVVIPNWADGQAIHPVERQGHPVLRELGLADKFVVQYSGNIGLFHEIETIVKAAELLKNDKGIQFLFIGDGGQLPWLQSQVEERGLTNVTLMPFQPKERLPLTLTACDASLVTLKGEVTGFCVPSKLYGALAAGKPVLCVANPAAEPARKVQHHGCGMTVSPGDSVGLAQAISAMKSDSQACQMFGRAARLAFEQHYSQEKVAAQYSELLNGLMQ